MAHDSVQSVAARNVQCDLKFLNSSPFSAADTAYLRQVEDAYIAQHPLGFLAASSPIIAQSMSISAMRADVMQQLRAYNTASGNFDRADLQIANLHGQSSGDFASAVPQIVTDIHREVLSTTRMQFQQMADVSQKLWGTGNAGQAAFHNRFQSAVQELDRAINLLDHHNTSEAFQIFQRVVATHRDVIQEFQWAGNINDGLRFGTTVGIGVGAGFLAFWSSGATLGAMGVEAGADVASIPLGAMVASMGVGGLTLTTANHLLNHMVFDTRLLAPGSVTEKAVDFTGEVLTNAAFMGFMPLAGAPLGSATAIMSDSSFATRALMTTSNVSYEFAAMTAFNASTTGLAHLTDPAGYAAASDVLKPESLAHAFGVLLGMKGANRAITLVADPRSLPGRVIRMPAFAMMGMMADPIGVSESAVVNSRVDPKTMLGALLMINAGVPASIITSQFLGIRPHTPADDLMISQIREAAMRPSIAKLRQQIMAGDPSPDLQAAHFFQSVMATVGTAVAHDTTLGFEYEYHPFGASRDAAYHQVAQVFKDAGFGVELIEGHPQFTYITNTDKILPVVWGNGSWQGTSFTTEILTGTGAKVVSVTTSPDHSRSVMAPPNMPSLYETTPLLAKLIAEALGMHNVSVADVIDTVRSQGHYDERYLFHVKADDFDILYLGVEVLGNARARLSATNGKVYDAEGVAQDGIEIDYSQQLRDLKPEERESRPDLRAIDDWLKQHIPGKAFAAKDDVITGIRVGGVGQGVFEIVAEASPFKEAVTPILRIPEVGSALHVVNAFKEAGYGGTRAGYLIGMHVHVGVSEKVNGRFSVAPALRLMQAFNQYYEAFYRIIPSHENRRGFMQLPPEPFQTLLREKNYMTDPSSPAQILRFIADYSMHHPPKYAAMNLDNWGAHIVNAMGHAGAVHDGQTFNFDHVRESGERMNYRIKIKKEGDIYKAMRSFDDGDVAITRVSSNLKPTAELRMPDTINDPEAVEYIATFWAAFVDHYGNGPFIP